MLAQNEMMMTKYYISMHYVQIQLNSSLPLTIHFYFSYPASLEVVNKLVFQEKKKEKAAKNKTISNFMTLM